MPTDNATAIAPGEDVAFPENGVIANTNIGRASNTSFLLSSIGTYLIQYTLTAAEGGQLVLTLNGNELAYTVVGRSGTDTEIVGTALITTTATNSVLTLRNPRDNTTSLTLTPTAGGTEPVSAHLTIVQLA